MNVAKLFSTRRGLCFSAGMVVLAFVWLAMAWSPATAQVDNPEDMRSFQGLLAPDQQVVLYAPVEGILKGLDVHEGDRVKKGATLASMDDRVQLERVAVAKIRLESKAQEEQARLAAEEAKITWERAVESFESDAASEWEVRRAKLQYDQQLTQIAAIAEEKQVAEGTLRFEQARLDQFRIEAPFDGVVVEIATEAGATLRPDDPVVTLVSLATLKAELHLPVSDFGKLEVGKHYRLYASSPISGEIVGKLVFVDPRINPASRTVRCILLVDNADGKLPSGAAVRLIDLNPTLAPGSDSALGASSES